MHLKSIKHPNIIEVHDLYIDFDQGYVFLVMEYFEADEMFAYLGKVGFYTEEVAKKLMYQLFTAIDFLHEQGIVHRDLKPNNLLVSKEHLLKITDFNVAKFFDDKYKDSTVLGKFKFKMHTYTGTIAFSAPEIFESDCYTEAVDVWSAGCVLYTMLCGYQPFDSE